MIIKSSPRSWGCFQVVEIATALPEVFPTLVGVFPMALGTEAFAQGLPHARGGVSVLVIRDSRPVSVFPTLVGVFPHWQSFRLA